MSLVIPFFDGTNIEKNGEFFIECNNLDIASIASKGIVIFKCYELDLPKLPMTPPVAVVHTVYVRKVNGFWYFFPHPLCYYNTSTSMRTRAQWAQDRSLVQPHIHEYEDQGPMGSRQIIGATPHPRV